MTIRNYPTGKRRFRRADLSRGPDSCHVAPGSSCGKGRAGYELVDQEADDLGKSPPSVAKPLTLLKLRAQRREAIRISDLTFPPTYPEARPIVCLSGPRSSATTS
jgi:hypothetical protein